MCDTCDWEDTIEEIEDTLAEEGLSFGEDFLRSVLETIRLNEHVTTRQVEAVDNTIRWQLQSGYRAAECASRPTENGNQRKSRVTSYRIFSSPPTTPLIAEPGATFFSSMRTKLRTSKQENNDETRTANKQQLSVLLM